MSVEYTSVTQDVENQMHIHNTMIETDDSTCSICKETLVNTERYISSCNHTYHYNCIHRHMLTLNATCPLCRKEIKLNKLISNTQIERSFINEFFNADIGNFYLVTATIYQCIIFPTVLFNISVLFVAFVGLIKFKFEPLVENYFIVSLILGTVQSLVNSRVRAILDEYYKTHQQTERFGKTEVTMLQVLWTILYLALVIYTIYVISFLSNHIL